MANAAKGRIACVDLDDDRASAYFSDALSLAKRHGDLLPYPELFFSNDVEEMTPQIFKRPSSNCVLKKPAANKGKTECIDGKKSEGNKSKTDIECILVKSLKKSL